jgi:hypothetical protein
MKRGDVWWVNFDPSVREAMARGVSKSGCEGSLNGNTQFFKKNLVNPRQKAGAAGQDDTLPRCGP